MLELMLLYMRLVMPMTRPMLQCVLHHLIRRTAVMHCPHQCSLTDCGMPDLMCVFRVR